jgi:hypothetical protein
MKNKIFIPILILLNAVVGYLIFDSVKEDIEYANRVDSIDQQVIARLKQIQTAQLAYKDMTGSFAPTFDSLFLQFRNGKYTKIKSIGDLDKDSLSGLKIDTLYLDPIVEFFGEGFQIEKIAFVPPMDTAKFKLESGFVEKNYIKVPVFEVTDPYPYNKNRTLKVGSMQDAIYSGNWK